ncbi:hypothetical protein L9F63_023025 [Diploptera punctata]|uniref:Uncharacterized protein n=1 Tax=Diploptera punctata TaxID=6984 RepID=A0AAD7ZM75_DIPPU|nr:hypothetical protein L9F63_023025 [Diploptera punctata]
MGSQASNISINSKASQYIQDCAKIIAPQKMSLKELIDKSTNFPIKFPVNEMMCQSLLRNRKDITSTKLEQFVSSVYPLIHEAVFHLIINFLEYKKKHGTDKEIKLYSNMSLTDFVHRLLVKRAVMFCDSSDDYLLINGESGSGGWKKIGKDYEQYPLVLENCLSYDEIKISAFLSVSSNSFFINDGSRGNMGIPSSNPNAFQHDGVIIGVIGARFEKLNFMEWEEIIISKQQNTEVNGYGSKTKNMNKQHLWRKIWAEFYGIRSNLPTYKESLEFRDQYKELTNDLMFNNEVYRKRITITAETLLLESESRASANNTQACVKVVGCGLGVWQISSHQQDIFLETFAECIRRLFPKLNHIYVVHFVWFKNEECGGVKNGDFICKRHDGSGIKVEFSMGTPHSKLDDGKYLVASYAWDGNALPGNEFWAGCLSSSGDPAAACSSQVAELHNPYINTSSVCGDNLHVATAQWGVLHVAEYARKFLNAAGH